MTDGRTPAYRDWSGGYDPETWLDRAINATRTEVFPAPRPGPVALRQADTPQSHKFLWHYSSPRVTRALLSARAARL